jgi:hypothetical protein
MPVTRRRQILASVCGLVLLLLVAPVLYWNWVVRTRNAALAELTTRDTRDSVLRRLGRPDRIYPCGQNLWWGSDGAYLGRNDGRCVTSWSWDSFLIRHEVGFDKTGLVVSKYVYESE